MGISINNPDKCLLTLLEALKFVKQPIPLLEFWAKVGCTEKSLMGSGMPFGLSKNKTKTSSLDGPASVWKWAVRSPQAWHPQQGLPYMSLPPSPPYGAHSMSLTLNRWWGRGNNVWAHAILSFPIFSSCSVSLYDADLGLQDLLLRLQCSNTHTQGLQGSCGGKGTAQPLSQEESASDRLSHSLKGGAPRALPWPAFIGFSGP